MISENDIYDLIIIGGGPSGTVAARRAKECGIERVLVIEEHASIGSPVQCAGLLSAAALLETDMAPNPSFVFNAVSGASVYPPSGEKMDVVGKEIKAYVVSRKMFDRQLAEKAAAIGAEFLLKTFVSDLKRESVPTDSVSTESGMLELWNITVSQNGEEQQLYSKVIIAADGARSQISKKIGLKPCGKILSGIQIETAYRSDNPDFVEIFVGSQVPGFFAWSIPVSDSLSRIGLAVDPTAVSKNGNGSMSANDFLESLLSNPAIQNKISAGHSDFVVGSIPLGPMPQTYAAGFMVIGDAAGQCKPVSGGGIYTGAVAAKIAAETAATAIADNNFSESKMSEYEKRWKKELGFEFDVGMKIHSYRMKLTDDEMNKMFAELSDPEISKLITEYGDMDHPTVLIQKIMFSKHSLKMMKLFGTFLKTLI